VTSSDTASKLLLFPLFSLWTRLPHCVASRCFEQTLADDPCHIPTLIYSQCTPKVWVRIQWLVASLEGSARNTPTEEESVSASLDTSAVEDLCAGNY
jgi:hypothetical protein